jgi:hypothetical protein
MRTLREALFVHSVRTILAPDESIFICIIHAFVTDGAVVLRSRRAALFHRVGLFGSVSSLAGGSCVCVSNALVDNGVGCRRRMHEYFLKFGGEKCSVG